MPHSGGFLILSDLHLDCDFYNPEAILRKCGQYLNMGNPPEVVLNYG